MLHTTLLVLFRAIDFERGGGGDVLYNSIYSTLSASKKQKLDTCFDWSEGKPIRML